MLSQQTCGDSEPTSPTMCVSSLLLFVTPVCPVVLCVCVKYHLSKETMEALRLPTFDAWQWEPNEVRLIH